MLEENARQNFHDIGPPESIHCSTNGIDKAWVDVEKKDPAVAFPLWERVLDASFDDVLDE
jgi:hypothetical protein